MRIPRVSLPKDHHGHSKLLTLVALNVIILLLLVFEANALSISVSGNPAKTVNDTGVRIEWNTDDPASSRVDYGTDPTLGLDEENLAFVNFHRIQIDGLIPNTQYFFQLISIAQDGSFQVANNNNQFYVFTTILGADTNPPNFLDIRASSFGASSTTFQWETNEDADTRVYYGQAKPYTEITDDAFVTDHVVTLPTDTGRIYTIIIGGCDEYQNCENATEQTFLAGAQAGIPPLVLDIPERVRSNRLDIIGVTRPYSEIEVLVEGIFQRRGMAEGNGSFRIPNIILTNTPESVLQVTITDAAGNEVTRSQQVTIDSVPPNVQITTVIPPVSSATPLTISGTVDEHVTIFYEVQHSFDTVPPQKVTGLSGGDLHENGVTLSWAASQDADIHEYGVYRDDILIAVTPNEEYQDATNTGTNYVYRVAAFDQACNEGIRSSSVIVQIPSGGTEVTGEPTPAQPSCVPQRESLEADGAFTFSVPLNNGNNQVRITVEDDAGNQVQFIETTRLDNTPPQILEHNLARLSPTYIPEINVKGKVSEKATVFIYVGSGDDPEAFELTDDEGNFDIKVKLERFAADISGGIGSGGISGSATTGGVPNDVRIEAIDLAGLKGTAGPVQILYTVCGEGSWFDVDIGEISPTILTPRLIVEGIQQIGFPVNISYRGAYNATIQRVKVEHLLLSPDEEDDFDTDWAQIAPIFNRRNWGAGYIQIAFVAQQPEKGQTTAAKETEIAENRKGDCAAPGLGCAKFQLVLEIQAQELIPKQFIDPRTDLTTGDVTIEQIRQRVCVPIEVQMDVPLHLGEKIPKKFLEASSEFLGSAIDVIDSVLKPLTTVGTFTLYSCFAMSAWLFVKTIDETFSCDVGQITTAVSGKGGFKKEVAEIGACDKVYKDEDDQALEACKKCQSAIEGRVSHERNLQLVCDRVACPSAPTLQTYIKDKQNEGVKKTGFIDPQTEQQLYSGSSCAFLPKDDIPQGVPVRVIDFRPLVIKTPTGFGYTEIRDHYLQYLEHKDDEPSGTDIISLEPQQQKISCAGLHPADVRCCGFEYDQEWGSACGIPGLIETFSEIEQSACLAAQTANSVPAFESAASNKKGSPVKCNSLFNAAAGFCQPDGKPQSEIIATGVFYNDKPTDSALSRQVYISIDPFPPEDPRSFQVHRGYFFNRFVEDKQGELTPDTRNTERTFTEKYNFISDKPLTDHFTEIDPDKQTPLEGQVARFRTALCGDLQGGKKDCELKHRAIYDQVKSKIGVPDRTYIVRPDQDGILRSVQCVCLPAVTSYLSYWRNVLGHIQTCVDHVRLTGEGSAGVCQAVLSTYVCDFLFDTLRCFMQKFGSPGVGGRTSQKGIGDVLGGLTKAGSRVQTSIQSRYGQSALWRTMFTERKLLHGACAFAFTGQWDFDVSGIFEQTVDDIPIQSQGLLYPADRRYVAYNPLTKPSGLTTWVYHFGVGLVAGADLEFQLKLKCSNSFRCSELEGFKDGKCDCFGQTEKILPVIIPELGTGRLSKNDLLNTELFFTVQAGQAGSDVRYDTAILEWTYEDIARNRVVTDQIEKKIGLVGGQAPGICSLKLLGTPFFVCDFGVGDYAGARFTTDPKLTSPANVILLDNSATFTTNIQLLGSTDPRQQGGSLISQNTKYLVYEMRNGFGTLIADNRGLQGSDPPQAITTEGEKAYQIVIPSAKLSSAAWGATARRPFSDSVTMYTPDIGPRNAQDNAKRFIDPVQTNVLTTPRPGSRVNLVFVFTDNAGNYEVYGATGQINTQIPEKTTETQATGEWGYWKKIPPAQILPSGSLDANDNLVYTDTRTSQAKIQIGFLIFPQGKPPAGTEIRVDYGPQTGGGGCNNFKDKPDNWEIVFTIYDSKKPQYGGFYEPNLDQPAVDALGEIQKKTLKIGAVCNTEYRGTGVIAGYPAELKNVCSDKAEVENKIPCFCGTAAKAQSLLQLGNDENNIPILRVNCGPASPPGPASPSEYPVSEGAYCHYDDADERFCSEFPGVSPVFAVPETAPTTEPAPQPAPFTPIPNTVPSTATVDQNIKLVTIFSSVKSPTPNQLREQAGAGFAPARLTVVHAESVNGPIPGQLPVAPGQYNLVFNVPSGNYGDNIRYYLVDGDNVLTATEAYADPIGEFVSVKYGMPFINVGSDKNLRLMIFDAQTGAIVKTSRITTLKVGAPIIMLQNQAIVPQYFATQTNLQQGTDYQLVSSYAPLDSPAKIVVGTYLVTLPNVQEQTLADLKKLYDAYIAYLTNVGLNPQ